MINFDLRNLSDIKFKGPRDVAITVEMHFGFGMVVFNEVTTDVKWGVKSGTITRTVIATNPGEDYSFLYT